MIDYPAEGNPYNNVGELYGMTPAIARDVGGIIAVLHLLSDRQDMAIVDICMVFISVRWFFFHCSSASRSYCMIAPQTAGRRVPLCVHDCRAFRTVQAALQTSTAVVGSHELGSCGNGGYSML